METLQHTQAILCDWDDTKVSTFQSCVDLYNNFAKAEELAHRTVEEILPHWGKPIRKILSELWPDIDEEQIDNRFWAYVERTDFSIKPFPSTRETILQLRAQKYILGIVSSSTRNVIDKTIRMHLDLPHDMYHFIQTSEDTPVHKPDPLVFNPAFEKLREIGITEEQSLYVGDALTDLYAARARWIRFIAVTTGFTTKEHFIQNGLQDELVLPSFDQLPALLRRISR